ncbi:hypothetical protein RV13_GL002288 [Enterococcus raffinosus]|nr:hypothetical protein RV13_GL002288 [Enterococcus raffinosus]
MQRFPFSLSFSDFLILDLLVHIQQEYTGNVTIIMTMRQELSKYF